MTIKRDASGKFAAGNKGGPGRPKKEKEIKFYETTISAVSLSDWREIIKKAVDQAKRGNPVARKFLADYLVGVPETPISGDLNIVINWDDDPGDSGNVDDNI